MLEKIVIGIAGLFSGLLAGVVGFFFIPSLLANTPTVIISGLGLPRKEVIGFLPYWQTNTAKTDYGKYITTLTYFGLALGPDGKILKLANPQQLEPGWNAFSSGKITPFLTIAKNEHVKLSLLVFSGNIQTIESAIEDPDQHAKNLIHDVEPLMQQQGFSDLNLDIEYTADASPAARNNFTKLVTSVKKNLPSSQTLSVEVMSTDAIKQNLIDIQAVGKIADHIIIMAYDYHSPDSFVTGPIAPLSGAGIDSEYDVTTAVKKTTEFVSSEKVILGMPLYGYEWESLLPNARSAVIAGSGVIASNHRGEALLTSCSTCSSQLDNEAQEEHISYLDTDTHTYHQLFIPTKVSTQSKLDVTNAYHLGGVALWALGYEGETILSPLTAFH